MRGVVLTRPGGDLEIATDLEFPEPMHGQVSVQVAFSGVCHSQLMEARGLRGEDRYVPHLLGHEGTGVVRAIGSGVTKVAAGDRVVLTWIKGEGLDVGGGRYGWNGRRVNAGAVTTFNEVAVVAENRVVRLPAGVPMDVGVLLGCALPTGAGVVCNTLQPEPGRTLVVYGLGGVGICALAAASRYGLKRLIAVDVEPGKLSLAHDFGATDVIDASREEPVEVIRGLTDGRGADYAVEAAGGTATIERAFSSVCDDGGRCVFASHPPAGKRICLDPHALIRGRRIEGSWGGGCLPDRDIPLLASLCLDPGLPFRSLVRDRYPLAEVNRALADLETRRAMRPLLVVAPELE
ncbi:MAG: zinc-binding dehydrogenase [Planctomycetes bacterium]|nr:zinc-binding dehydrogenase [Planctomycetota bacterium]